MRRDFGAICSSLEVATKLSDRTMLLSLRLSDYPSLYIEQRYPEGITPSNKSLALLVLNIICCSATASPSRHQILVHRPTQEALVQIAFPSHAYVLPCHTVLWSLVKNNIRRFQWMSLISLPLNGGFPRPPGIYISVLSSS